MPTATLKKRKVKQAPTKAKELDYSEVFAFHGIHLEGSGAEQIGDCPFCVDMGRGEQHFFVNIAEGLWNCKHCHYGGNIYGLLHRLYLRALDNTTESKLAPLATYRKLPKGAMLNAGFAYDASMKRYLYPVLNRNAALVNLKAIRLSKDKSKNRLLASPKPLEPSLGGAERLKHAHSTIIVCEGEWDRIALDWYLSQIPASRRPKYTAIDSPGDNVTSIWTPRVMELMRDKKVIFFFDKGDSAIRGTRKAMRLLYASGVKNLHYLNWPDSYPDKYDVSDHLGSTKLGGEKSIEQLMEWVEPVSTQFLNQDKDDSTVSVVVSPEIQATVPPRSTFAEVLLDFEDNGVFVNPGIEAGLALTAAAGISNAIPTDAPLWMFLVGASGSGKSLVLESTLDSEHFLYRSTTNSRNMVSGYRGEGEDQSCLLRLIAGKTFIVKDYTTILTMHEQEQKELSGILREAYDGAFSRSYGTGKHVDHVGYFTMVAGVTNKIHSIRSSNLGERFLKYEIAKKSSLGNLNEIKEAMNLSLDPELVFLRKKNRVASFCSFVDHAYDKVTSGNAKSILLSEHQKEVVAALSQFTAVCRAVIERDRDGALQYGAGFESATRLAKQLSNLPISLCHVYNQSSIDSTIYHLVRKTAWDTAYGRMREIFAFLYSQRKKEASIDLLHEATEIPKQSLRRVTADLMALDVLTRRTTTPKAKGRPELVYTLTPDAVKVFKLCGFKSLNPYT